MIKFQIGKITIKKILGYWIIALIFTIINYYDLLKNGNLKEKIVILGVFSIVPGMIFSVLFISIIKEVYEIIKEKNYVVIIAFIIFVYFFTKYYFKL